MFVVPRPLNIYPLTKDRRFKLNYSLRHLRHDHDSFLLLQPEELSLKTEGNVLVILAKHETQTETGGSFVSKQFEQRFSLPSGVKPEAIVSSLSKEGVLTVTAPRVTSAPTSIGGFRKTRGAIEEENVFVPQTTQVSAEHQGRPSRNTYLVQVSFIKTECICYLSWQKFISWYGLPHRVCIFNDYKN